jgi:hypothetical protein
MCWESHTQNSTLCWQCTISNGSRIQGKVRRIGSDGRILLCVACLSDLALSLSLREWYGMELLLVPGQFDGRYSRMAFIMGPLVESARTLAAACRKTVRWDTWQLIEAKSFPAETGNAVMIINQSETNDARAEAPHKWLFHKGSFSKNQRCLHHPPS